MSAQPAQPAHGGRRPSGYVLTARGIVALALDDRQQGHSENHGWGKPRGGWRLTDKAIELLDAEQD